MRILLSLSLLLGFQFLRAQAAQIGEIKTFPVNATLIASLEGSQDRALMRIDKIERNKFGLEVGDTILAKFYFSLKKVKSEPNLVGINAGDFFSARMAARPNSLGGGHYFQVYHYRNMSYLRSLKREEALSSDESQ